MESRAPTWKVCSPFISPPSSLRSCLPFLLSFPLPQKQKAKIYKKHSLSFLLSGRMTFKNGDILVADWNEGALINFPCTFQYHSASKYVGEINSTSFARDGFGIYYSNSTGDRYYGMWLNNQKSGLGMDSFLPHLPPLLSPLSWFPLSSLSSLP
jgi:hypothetical protein